jgi:hypothetical protein
MNINFFDLVFIKRIKYFLRKKNIFSSSNNKIYFLRKKIYFPGFILYIYIALFFIALCNALFSTFIGICQFLLNIKGVFEAFLNSFKIK